MRPPDQDNPTPRNLSSRIRNSMIFRLKASKLYRIRSFYFVKIVVKKKENTASRSKSVKVLFEKGEYLEIERESQNRKKISLQI